MRISVPFPINVIRPSRAQFLRQMSSLNAAAAPAPSSSSPSTSTSKSPIRIPGPVETNIQRKLIENFQPTLMRISNDSSKHSHHSAMRAMNGGGGETHFAISLVSPTFIGKTQIARHRMINTLLKEEFETLGLHTLSLRLKTPDEWEKEGGGGIS